MADDEKATVEGFFDERGIFITKEGMARARARRLESAAKLSSTDLDALRARYGLRNCKA
ncbi:MAG TPA: hypothetical protein VGQ92_03470 [Actinoplanes sp.]|jgi:hypothetical protein|nr:hypothetical protein [Actinoplanes sp.]